MHNDPFNAFIELIDFDKKAIKTEVDINSLKSDIKNQSNEIERLLYDIEQSKNFWVETRKSVDDQELKMKELDQQEKEKKQKLEFTHTPKEYSAIKKEVDLIKQNQYNLEPALLEMWKKSESAKKEFEDKKVEATKKIELLENSITEKTTNINFLEIQLNELKKERTQKSAGIPEEWIEKYNLMRLKVSNPVVPVENNSCSACFYLITSQDLIHLKHKKLLQCKRCYRFLFIR